MILYLTYFTKPHRDIFEGLDVGDIKHKYSAISSSVVGSADGLETFLAGSIPMTLTQILDYGIRVSIIVSFVIMVHVLYSVNLSPIARKLVFSIRKTCPCDSYPLTPHFYIVKLWFTGVYIIFLFLL